MVPFRSHMMEALKEARLAGSMGEVPVGAAVIDPHGAVIATAGNRVRRLNDPSGHAEMRAIRRACQVFESDRLTGFDLYVTLEPCAMCAGLISHARIARVYYGASDPKSGGVAQGARVFDRSQSHHTPEVYDGIMEQDCAELLREFFQSKR